MDGASEQSRDVIEGRRSRTGLFAFLMGILTGVNIALTLAFLLEVKITLP